MKLKCQTWSKTSLPTLRDSGFFLTQMGIMRPKKREKPRMKRFRDELRSTNLGGKKGNDVYSLCQIL